MDWHDQKKKKKESTVVTDCSNMIAATQPQVIVYSLDQPTVMLFVVSPALWDNELEEQLVRFQFHCNLTKASSSSIVTRSKFLHWIQLNSKHFDLIKILPASPLTYYEWYLYVARQPIVYLNTDTVIKKNIKTISEQTW